MDSRLLLTLDTAVFEYSRQNWAHLNGARFCFADSSEKGGRDWLLPVVKFVEESDLIPTFEAVGALARDAVQTAAAVDDFDDDDEEPMLPRSPIDRPLLASQAQASAIFFFTLRLSTRDQV